MEITILCENASSDVGCLAEWGFSAFIRFKGTNVLFDTGYSDVYLHNAKQLNHDKASKLVMVKEQIDIKILVSYFQVNLAAY